jgi:phosphatidate cytidylyltransferase
MKKDFWIRFASSTTLVALAMLTVIIGDLLLAAVLLLVSLVAYKELLKAFNLTDTVNKRPGALEALGTLAIDIYYLVLAVSGFLSEGGVDGMILFAVVLGALLVYLTYYVLVFPKYTITQIAEAFFCFLYAPVMLSCIYLTRHLGEYGPFVVWLIFLSSWVSDAFAYCVGITMGKRKIFPTISPKKTLEGAAGGVFGAMLCTVLYCQIFVRWLAPELNVVFWFTLISGVGAVISQVGDLVASGIKRNHGIKDFGTLIPGHGGMVDRFDSVIFIAPVVYVLALVVL